MLIGAQVRSSGGLAAALDRGRAMGAEVVQVFTQNPRGWRPTVREPAALAAYRTQGGTGPATIRALFCHATYLINLASPDAAVYERSCACLVANLAAATAMGADGLVLHVGSHRGAGLAASLGRVGAGLGRALDEVEEACPILIENTAGAGGTIGRSFEELAVVIGELGGDRRLGVCLDTQHLWASGTSYASPAEVEGLVAGLDAAIGRDRLACLHVNDSKVPLGANRDRHANLGEGTIGLTSLAWLLGHPALAHLPAILEVPGTLGHGPDAADLERARAVRDEGVRLWAGRRPAAGRGE